MGKFTPKMKRNGEMAVWSMSEKAQWFYSNTDPISVYEYPAYNPELPFDADWDDYEDTDLYVDRYAVRGYQDFDDMTFEELEAYLEACTDSYNAEVEAEEEDDDD